ncbi:MAG: M43 family zinc metalloprotease [Bacteroidota bacterium]
MKKLLFVLVSLFTMSTMYSQNCGVPESSLQEMQDLYSTMANLRKGNFRENISNQTSLKFKVRFLVVRKDDGSWDSDLTLPTINNSLIGNMITQANQAFQNANIEFESCGVDYINNSNLTSASTNSLNRNYKYLRLTKYYPDAINVHIVSNLDPGIDGFAFKQTNPEKNNIVILDMGAFEIPRFNNDYQVFIHELGHFFGLGHTYEPAGELVTRVGGNCATAGDGFCDTPADDNGSINSNCLYLGTSTDLNGDQYMPDVTNFMSNYFPCTNNFSSEQIMYMNTIASTHPNRINLLNSPCVPQEATIGDRVEFEDTSDSIAASLRSPYFLRSLGSTPIIGPRKHVFASSGTGNFEYTDDPDFVGLITTGAVSRYDGDWNDGLSVFDLLLINKHILNIEPFTSGYQIVASDANGDGRVSSFDLVQLQQLNL